MNKRKIIVLLILFIAVIGFSMSAVTAGDTASKTFSTKSYKYRNINTDKN